MSPYHAEQSSGGHRRSESYTDSLPSLNNFLNEPHVRLDTMEHLRDLQVAVKEFFHLWQKVFTGYETRLCPPPLHRTSIIINKAILGINWHLTDTGLKDAYTRVPLIYFWAGLEEELPPISNVTMKKLFSFPSTYVRNSVLKICINVNEIPNMFNAEHDMRLQLFKFVPDFNSLVASKKVHSPHHVSTNCFLNTHFGL
jgi:hypothetical protein